MFDKLKRISNFIKAIGDLYISEHPVGSIVYTGFISKNAQNMFLLRNRIVDNANDSFHVEVTDHVRYVFDKEAYFTTTGSFSHNGTYSNVRWYGSNNVIKIQASDVDASTGNDSVNITGKANIGDYIILTNDATINSDSYGTHFGIVVFPIYKQIKDIIGF